MERRFISFRATDRDPCKLRTVCSSYFAYEHAHVVRHLLTWRMVLLVLGTCALTLLAHVLPIAALVIVATLAVLSVALCVGIEIKARRRFLKELDDVPEADGLETR